MTDTNIYFAKVRPTAIIPSKTEENAGYDIYANFDGNQFWIGAGKTETIPTGICSMFSKEYFMEILERGSTGSKGFGRRCGVIDSNYRGEWFAAITNHNDKDIVIYKNDDALFDGCIKYPYSKAIAQAVLLPVPTATVVEISFEELQSFTTDRGAGMLGSSGK